MVEWARFPTKARDRLA
uniref:Uncharacterized protein n=1 Tax=Anguilla anguilla TaxID=7936 RepID=A0A0E9UYW6_ANGAN